MCHKVDLTTQDESGQCPIHLAAAHGNTFTLQTICRKGGDLHLRDINGWRAVHHASYNGKLGYLLDNLTQFHGRFSCFFFKRILVSLT